MKKILLIAVAVIASMAVSAQYKAPQIIANGGYHRSPNSGASNSMSALKAAQKAKLYGSECDANLTKDGEVVAVNNGWHPNSKASKKAMVHNVSKDKILATPHANGELPSTLEDMIKRAAKKPQTKLIIEIKNQTSPKLETKLIEKVIALVTLYNMEANVEYIALHPWSICELVRLAPKGTKIAYFNGDYAPAYVKGMGCSGIDYHISKIKKKRHWIKEAKELGLTVNVWGVDKVEDISWCVQNGVDFITTNDVKLAQSMVKSMCGK